jgi:alcohol dehydrogenase
LLVVDPAIVEAELLEPLIAPLRSEGLRVFTFSDVEPEPWVETADEAGRITREEKCDSVIGAGGGSAMDVAKAAAVLATNPGKASDYQGLDLVKKPGLPKIMVPTTAGTGSEVTFTSVLSRKKPKMKAGINGRYLFPEIAVLDPALTFTVPSQVTATTGMDALTHAIEAYTSLQASPLSDTIAREAIKLIGANLRTAVHEGENLTARSNMLLGSLLGGIALANAGVGAVHALAYPLGGSFRIPHGVANGLLLAYVMEFNASRCTEKYADAALLLGEQAEGDGPDSLAQKAISAVRKLGADIKIPRRLRELNIEEKYFPEMADSAMKVSRPLENNPRKVSKEDALAIYAEAL